MKGNSFLTFGNEPNHRSQVVLNSTSHAQHNGADDSDESAVGDSHLRSCALKSAKQGHYSQAIALLSQLIHRYPQNAVDYNNRGLIYFQSGDSQRAFCDYNTALQLNPNLASAYNNRANYYASCGEFLAAIADYDRALDLNPSYARAWFNRGITLRDLGQYEDAIDNFDVALLFGQIEVQILAERGRTYHLWGDWNCAIADYRRALAQLPLAGADKDNSNWRCALQIENWLNNLLCPNYC